MGTIKKPADVFNGLVVKTVASSSAATDSDLLTISLGTDSETSIKGFRGNLVLTTSAASATDIELDPDTTGKVVFKGNANRGSGQFVLNCENNSHGIIIKGPPHSAGASYTLVLPDTDGAANQVLKTDGNGNLAFVNQSSGNAIAVKDEGTSLTTAVSTIDFAGAGVTATESSGTVTVTIPGGGSSTQNEVSTFIWTGGYPVMGAGSSSTLGTSYSTSTNMLVFDIPSSTTNLRRSYTSKSILNVSASGAESSQIVYIRLQIKAPGASTSRITLGTANFYQTLGTSYGARTKWYISGNVTKYLSGSKISSSSIGGKVSKTNSNSPSSTQQWNLETAWYDSANDRTYFITPYNGAAQMFYSGSAAATVYLDPFGYAAVNTWVTFDESKEAYRMHTYNMGATMVQSLPLVYSSYAMQCRLQWRKWTSAGATYLEDVTGEIVSMPIA